MTRWTFTSESVTEGHPDKMADQISDAVLDAILAQDPAARVACETLITTGLVVVAGDLFDFAFRSNSRNMKLVRRHLDKHHPQTATLEGEARRL